MGRTRRKKSVLDAVEGRAVEVTKKRKYTVAVVKRAQRVIETERRNGKERGWVHGERGKKVKSEAITAALNMLCGATLKLIGRFYVDNIS